MKDLLNDIITAYSSLWSFKKRGNSIEIVTPVSTTNDVFVSVFLTMRGDEYVVTDGGWIDAGVYDIDEVNNKSLMLFRVGLEELLKKETRTEDEEKFI